MIKSIPNILSFFRLAASFVLIPLILKNNFTWALVLFISASVSDFFDGYIARKFQVSSEFGAMLDPLADKTLVIISYLLLACVKFIPVYVTVAVVVRDLLILSAVTLCKIRRVELKMRPLLSSKINTAIQLVFIVSVLGCKIAAVNVECLLEVCAAVVVFSAIFSGARYVQKYFWIKDKFFSK
ncbi:MAG: CDP-alcohol phosphatidyltransferase family protein [Holosporaceae bacterium]|jgi:cardiolipin synthase|nr:CDP-alcohol phosphatidyltransferase family protein [Holosporaceae bacterium]